MLEVFVWSWSLSWWLVEDAAKVLCRWIVHKYNIFDINNTGEMELTNSAKKLRYEMRKVQVDMSTTMNFFVSSSRAWISPVCRWTFPTTMSSFDSSSRAWISSRV